MHRVVAGDVKLVPCVGTLIMDGSRIRRHDPPSLSGGKPLRSSHVHSAPLGGISWQRFSYILAFFQVSIVRYGRHITIGDYQPDKGLEARPLDYDILRMEIKPVRIAVRSKCDPLRPMFSFGKIVPSAVSYTLIGYTPLSLVVNQHLKSAKCQC